jgi:exodeoxyribonuclease V beta subunit
MKHFDLLDSPLEGTNLIEASAGTGKTYTIAGLFLRLVLEKYLSVNEILVVTFTEAATEELRGRIRKALREAVEGFLRGGSEDRFLHTLVQRHARSARAFGSLREALRDFDQAAIFTIHGFCRRMLHENAFESGSLFDTELLTHQEDIKRQIAEDFWRRQFYKASPLFVNYAMNNRFSPDGLLSLLGNRTGQLYLKIIPQVEISDTSLEEGQFKEWFERICLAWPSARAEVEAILKTDARLSRSKYKTARIPAWIRSMDGYVASGGNNPELFEGFEKFTARELEGATKKNQRPPVHPFFELCENLREKQKDLERVFEQRLLGLKIEFFQTVEDELTRRKRQRNVQFFDDLLIKMERALEGKGGEDLAKAIQMRFRAALIDEFQDTDRIQYAIFRQVFGDESSVLFLIGDPKQAIYSFRSADIFAYMDASRHVKSRYTLSENWRSEPALITATNTIFANAEHPFVYKEIPFQPAKPASTESREVLRIEGASEPPLQLWFLNPTKGTDAGKTMIKTQARRLIQGAVAAEIARLLGLARDNRVRLGERPLREGDIAVLVRRNMEARQVQKALSALKIPSVLYSTGNLFDSHEALEMDRVLAGIGEPNKENLLRAAVATDTVGVKGEELDDPLGDETEWGEWLVKFRKYHDLWNQGGFIWMLRRFMSEEGVLPRLMSLPDGERRCTNVLHLVEVLHQTSVERKLGMTGLLKWLSEQRDPRTPRLEEHRLRLESDENAVTLITIHKAKGLEYPVVFCPFSWDGSRIRNAKGAFTFHDPTDHMRFTLDLGSEHLDRNRVSAEKERLAENLRLLYVALTRAKNRCYLVWGRFHEAETSALAYLFHQPRSWDSHNVVDATGERFRGLSEEQVLMEVRTVRDKAGGTIGLSEVGRERGETYSASPGSGLKLGYRKFSGNIDRRWHISSFSSLVSGQSHLVELADRDAIGPPAPYDQAGPEEPGAEEKPSGVFSFPRGTRAGTLLHDIFEHLDFAQQESLPREKLVTDKLKGYGFDLTWQETICDMIDKVLSLSLDSCRGDFTLSRIQRRDRLNELEFYFPLKLTSPETLKAIFAQSEGPDLPREFPERIEGLRFSPVRGFMKGYIDMVFQFEGWFYLVDWKSNFLGGKLEDYGQDSLALAMQKEFYILQYHLYCVALHQYLGLRLPGYRYETHFGGVYYIFLRGVDPEKGSDFGIYRDRPSKALITALCTNLIDRDASQGRLM